MNFKTLGVVAISTSLFALSASAKIAERTGAGLWKLPVADCSIVDDGKATQYSEQGLNTHFGVYQKGDIRYDLFASVASVEGQKLEAKVTLSAYNVKENKTVSSATTKGGSYLELVDSANGVEIFCDYKVKRF